MAISKYGDISQRTAAWTVKELLSRAYGLLVLEGWGQAKPIMANTADTMKFRRYLALPSDATELTEGTTPSPGALTHEDISVTLKQYGYLLSFTDKVMDLCEDPILKEATDILGKQAAEMIEKVRWGKLLAGTNVVFSGTATQRDAVVAKIDKAMLRKVAKQLKRQHAQMLTSMVSASPNYKTESVSPTYIAITHTDMTADLRDLEGFIDVKNYGSSKGMPAEVGAWEDFRFIVTTVCPIFTGAGGASTVVTNTAGQADVYPILFIAENAYAIVPFKGANAVTPTVVNATPSDSDPLAQRTHVGWKAYQSAVILNDAWLIRGEVACSL